MCVVSQPTLVLVSRCVCNVLVIPAPASLESLPSFLLARGSHLVEVTSNS